MNGLGALMSLTDPSAIRFPENGHYMGIDYINVRPEMVWVPHVLTAMHEPLTTIRKNTTNKESCLEDGQ